MSVTAAPAFAASTNAITGVQQVVRNASGLSSTGSVTNNTTAVRTVTLTWDWLCNGTGTVTSGTSEIAGWNVISFTYVTASGST